MNNIWVDLTDMLVWRGHYTGVQRVTYEYASRYEKSNAKFFAYDTLDDRFFEVSLSEVLNKHKNIEQTQTKSTEDITLRRRIRKVIGSPYYRLDDESKAFFQPYVYALNHTVRSTIHLAQSITGKNNDHEQVSEYASYSTANFSQNDTVVLLGAGWNEIKILQQLALLKEQLGFNISQHINDMLPIYQPHLFADELPKYFTPFANLAITVADVITVISEATKRDVEIFCQQQGNEYAPRVEVIRLGDNPLNNDESKKPEGINDGEQFILSVGTFEIRKNYQVLYQAVKLGELEQKELPKIVIAGRKGWLTEDLRHVIDKDPFVKNRIIWLSNVEDDELKWLFENCMFTVFPSLAEGWGLPIAESLGYRKMCLASGVSSMLEIGQGNVDYFLPYDARECLEKLLYYVTDSRYIEKNLKVMNEYELYTWDKSYEDLLKAISSKAST